MGLNLHFLDNWWFKTFCHTPLRQSCLLLRSVCLCPFPHWGVFSPWSPLGTPNTNSLSDVCLADVFSPHVGCLSTLLRNSLEELKLLRCIIPFGYISALILKKTTAIQTNVIHLPCYFLLAVHSSTSHLRPQSASPILHRSSWVCEVPTVFRRVCQRIQREKVT